MCSFSYFVYSSPLVLTRLELKGISKIFQSTCRYQSLRKFIICDVCDIFCDRVFSVHKCARITVSKASTKVTLQSNTFA